jgi:hypothetical protein
MSADFLDQLPLDQLTPGRVWSRLDPGVREAAARSLLGQARADAALRRGVDAAIARALRFRPESVRRLSDDKKVGYLTRVVHPDDLLASNLLQSLHMSERRPLLGSFLDALGVPHRDGEISDQARLEPPAPEVMAAAVDRVYQGFPAAEVEVYLATLLALDPAFWGGLRPLLAARRGGA